MSEAENRVNTIHVAETTKRLFSENESNIRPPFKLESQVFATAKPKRKDPDDVEGSFDENDEDDEGDDAEVHHSQLNGALWEGWFPFLGTYFASGLITVIGAKLIGSEAAIGALVVKYGLASSIGLTAGWAMLFTWLAIPVAMYTVAYFLIRPWLKPYLDRNKNKKKTGAKKKKETGAKKKKK